MPLCNVGVDDRISNLHSSIIAHILSHLTMEEAVRTCILSKTWKLNWCSIYKIKISDAVWGQVMESLWRYRLIALYNKKILRDGLLNGNSAIIADTMKKISLSHHVTSFTLFCWENKYNLDQLVEFISRVMGRNLETFRLLYAHQGLILPQSLLQCTSLRNLELKLQCIFRVPSVVQCFPNLVNLSLHSVEIFNEDFNNTDTLTLKFQVLENLELYQCKWLNVKFVEIHSPTLTTFKSDNEYGDQEPDYLIKILRANLAYFETSYGYNFVFLGSSTIVTAAVHAIPVYEYFHEVQLQMQKLLTELSNVKHLILQGNVTEAIGHIDRGHPLTTYGRLEHLDIHARGCVRSEIEGLMKLLHATPFLKFLEIDVTHWDAFDEIKPVPSCVISSLEKVKFRNYYYEDHPFELEKFLLINGKKLETVVLVLYTSKQRDEIIKQLSTFPRASSTPLDIIVTRK